MYYVVGAVGTPPEAAAVPRSLQQLAAIAERQQAEQRGGSSAAERRGGSSAAERRGASSVFVLV